MADTQVPIGQVKRDISDLVNRVAYGGERIILTSRGKPKAALVSIEDCARILKEGGTVYARRLVANTENYERFTEEKESGGPAHLQTWLAQTDALVAEILGRHGGEKISVDDLLRRDREDLEARDGWDTSSH